MIWKTLKLLETAFELFFSNFFTFNQFYESNQDHVAFHWKSNSSCLDITWRLMVYFLYVCFAAEYPLHSQSVVYFKKNMRCLSCLFHAELIYLEIKKFIIKRILFPGLFNYLLYYVFKVVRPSYRDDSPLKHVLFTIALSPKETIIFYKRKISFPSSTISKVRIFKICMA